MAEELKKALAKALSDEKLRRTLERIVKEEEELRQRFPDRPEWWDWEIGDLGVEPWHVKKLVYMGIVKRTYSSSKHKYYKLVDYDLVKQALSQPSLLNVVKEGESKSLCNPIPDTWEEVFGDVAGYDDYKWLVWKALKKWEQGSRPAHFLLTGPPATGKTLFVECIEKAVGCAVYVAGEAARRGGFVERILDAYNSYGKKFILIIDEVDKLDSDALKTLYNLMEYRLNITVHGKMIDVDDMSVMVIGTTNQYHKLPEGIRSRFGIPLYFEKYSKEEYIEVVKKVLTTLEHVSPELAEYIAVRTAEEGVRDPRVARQIAQIVDTKEDVEKTIKTLLGKKNLV